MFGRIGRVVGGLGSLLAVLVLGSPVFAQGVTLPDTGVDVEGAITAAVTALGGIVSVAVLAYFAFLVIRWGLRWARKAAG